MPIVIAGAGGHGKVVCDTLLVSGVSASDIVGFVDDNSQKHNLYVAGYPVLGTIGTFPAVLNTSLALGVGNNPARAQILGRARAFGYLPINVVHPSALLGRRTVLGQGVVILAQVVVNTESQIGDGVILNTACSVDHECVIGDCVHIAPGARLAGGVRIGPGVLIGMGAVVVPGVSIGPDTVVGAGAVVLGDLPPRCVAVGNPARIIKTI